jgi:hypothetical protein
MSLANQPTRGVHNNPAAKRKVSALKRLESIAFLGDLEAFVRNQLVGREAVVQFDGSDLLGLDSGNTEPKKRSDNGYVRAPAEDSYR